jgi:hypothetical protein
MRIGDVGNDRRQLAREDFAGRAVERHPVPFVQRRRTRRRHPARRDVDVQVQRADPPEGEWAETLATPLELGGESAFDALQWVARELGKRLVFEDASTELLARNAIIHGNSAGLEPLQILEVVMTTSAVLEYTLGDGTLVIRRR